MMRAVAPIGTLSAPRAKQLLEETGWRGTGRVGIGVDAYAAVLAAMGGRLPDEESESHATPQTARQLKAGSGGVLMPFRLRSDPRRDVLSSKTHSKWYKFEVRTFSRLDLQLRSYPLLGGVSVTLEPDDKSSRARDEMVENRSPGFTHIAGLLAPGTYKVHVVGPLNLYELAVSLTDVPLTADQFEPNESFETSTHFRLLTPGDTSVVVPSLAESAGIYELTLHRPNDKDFFRIVPVATNPLSEPVARVGRSDLPLDITLFDAARNVITRQVGVRATKLTLPRTETSFIESSGTRATRYRLTLRFEVDPAHLPGSVTDQAVIPLPDLGDLPIRVNHGENHVLFQVDASRSARVLVLAAVEGQPMKVELLDNTGTVVRTAQRRENSLQESVELDVTGLQPGAHVLRVGHADARSNLSGTPLNVQVLPSFV
jgi:hypothetical protein